MSDKIPSWIEKRADNHTYPRPAALKIEYHRAIMLYGYPVPRRDPDTTRRIEQLEKHLSLPDRLSWGEIDAE